MSVPEMGIHQADLTFAKRLVCNHRGIFRTLCHALGGSGLHLVSGLLRSIFRRALGLQRFRVENAVMPKAAIGQRLRVIFKSIGRRFSSCVIYREQLILLHQHKLYVSPVAPDRSRLHIPRDPQALGVSAIAQLVQFGDGDVIALAVLNPGVGEITEQKQN